jgi:hypothetical protein
VLGRAEYANSIPLLFTAMGDHNMRRVKLILMSIEFTVEKRMGSTFGKDSMDSLHLFFEAIPDSLMTLLEAQE